MQRSSYDPPSLAHAKVVLGGAPPPPPILRTPKPTFVGGNGPPSSAHAFGITGSDHTAPGSRLWPRSNLSREAGAATVDAVGTRAYQLYEPRRASWVAASPRILQLGRLCEKPLAKLCLAASL